MKNDGTVFVLSLEQMTERGYSKFNVQSVRKTEISSPLVIWKRKPFLSVFFFFVLTPKKCRKGCVFTTTIVSLNIPEGVLFTEFVKRLKNDRCFHELN